MNCNCQRCARERVSRFTGTMIVLAAILLVGLAAAFLSGCASQERTYPAPPPMVLGGPVRMDPLPPSGAV